MTTRRKLMTHQKHALRYARHSDRRVALFLEMRLGKTLVAIRWAQRLEGPILVVAPLSVLHAWERELKLEGERCVILIGTRKQREQLLTDAAIRGGIRWCLVNYECLFFPKKDNMPAQPSKIARLPWSTVILDESALIRNPQAIRTKMCVNYLARSKHKAILSGLPNPEGVLDFFPQFQFLYGSFCGYSSFWHFRQARFQPDRFGHRWFTKRGTLRMIKQEVQSRAFIRTRKDVGLNNKHVTECRYVFLPAKISKAYEQIRKEFATGDVSTKWTVTKYMWLRQLASGLPKNPELPEHCEKIKEVVALLTGELKGQQVVIWHCFRREGLRMADALKRAKIKALWVHGDTPVTDRAKYRDRFTARKVRVMIMQVKCGQYGLDLSAASTAIYFSMPPSHDQFAQSKDRIEHPKKRDTLLSIFLLAKDTVDEDIYDALASKRWSSRSILGRLIDRLRKER